ncbi:MAG: glycosyltransferase [Phycisphaerales bacterium]|nr:glycosyltransferase [Phycisphaerales bacterium]
MRIMHIIDPTTPDESLADVAALVALLPQSDQSVAALGHSSVVTAAVLAGIPPVVISHHRSSASLDVSAWRFIARTAHDFAPTHVQVWGTGSLAALGALAYHPPGGCIATLPTLPPPGLITPITLALRRQPRWLFVGQSRRQTAALAARFGPAHQAVYVPPAIPQPSPVAPSQPPDASALKAMLDISADAGPLILLGGSPGPAFRHDIACWAAAIVQHVLPNATCLIHPSAINDKSHQAAERRLADFIHTSHKPEMFALAPVDMPVESLLPAADAFLFTPDSPAPAGSLLRAMAAAKPIAATNTSANREILRHNHTALLAPPNDPKQIAAALLDLIEPARMSAASPAAPAADATPLPSPQELSANAREHALTYFSAAAMADRYRSVYEQLLHQPQEPVVVLSAPPAVATA